MATQPTLEQQLPGVMTSGLITNKPVQINSDLTVTGTTNIAGVSLTDLSVTGNTTIGNATTDTLAVTGVSSFTSAAASTNVDIVSVATTTGKALDISDANALTTGIGVHVASSATAITGAGRLVYSNHTGATTTSGILNEFASAATDETVIAQVTASGANALGTALNVTTATTTGNGVVVDADALTTGTGLQVVSDSADTSSRSLISVVNDNTAAVGTVPISVTQDALISTNFKLVASLAGINIYISDQTSPNSVLTAPEGSICLNAAAIGQIAYNNNGTTGWQLITSA